MCLRSRITCNDTVMCFIIMCGLLTVQGRVTSTPIYENMCDKTVSIPSTSPVGRLHYTHYAKYNNTCNIAIETERYHRIGFFFLETSAFQSIRVEDDILYYSCRTWVQLADGSHRLSNTRCVYSNYNNAIRFTTSNKLKIEITGDDVTTFFFNLVFYSFHEGSCERHEQKCNQNYITDENQIPNWKVCIHTDLICDSAYSHVICNSSETRCSDFVADEQGNFVFSTAVIVCLTTVVVFIGLFCVVNYRRRCRTKNEEETTEDVPTIARTLFGSVTSDNCNHDVFQSLSAIDSSKFDPPPDYSTLETCDHSKNINVSDKTESRMSVVSLPSYSDVMNNCGDYSVTSHM